MRLWNIDIPGADRSVEVLRVVLAVAQEMQESELGSIPAWLTTKNAGISLSGSVYVHTVCMCVCEAGSRLCAKLLRNKVMCCYTLNRASSLKLTI